MTAEDRQALMLAKQEQLLASQEQVCVLICVLICVLTNGQVAFTRPYMCAYIKQEQLLASQEQVGD